MRQVSGFVLVKETNVGIPNLVVTAYDRDLGSIDHIDHAPTAALMKNLGRRLGSVLTDERGRFEMSAEDLAFSGNEPRPDLAIVVFGPEDIKDPERPYPALPEHRVLYMSSAPRADAGSGEVFVIRLLQAQLDRLLIDTRSQHLATALENAWQARDAITKRLATRYKEERHKSQDSVDAARKKTKDLSAVPHALRDHPLLAVGKVALEHKREDLQKAATKQGIKQMLSATRPPTMRLVLTEQQLKDLRLPPKDGKVSGKVSSKALFKQAATVLVGGGLLRQRPVDLADPSVLVAKYLRPSVPSSSPNLASTNIATPNRLVKSSKNKE